MSASFKVGEVCIFQNAVNYPQNNGREVTITAIGMLGTNGYDRYFGYQLDFVLPNGMTCVAHPYQLRRRKPPATNTHERTFMADIRKLADKAPQKVGEPC